MYDRDVAEAVQHIAERSAFWTAQGYHGRELYERLAADADLPEFFAPPVLARLLNVQVPALAQRRKRGDPPSFIRPSPVEVLYPRASSFMFLADRFVERRPALAQTEYTLGK